MQRGRRRLFRHVFGLFRRGRDHGRDIVHSGHDDHHYNYDDDDDDDTAATTATTAADYHHSEDERGRKEAAAVTSGVDDEHGETDVGAAAGRLVSDQLAGNDSGPDRAAQRVPREPQGTGTRAGAQGTAAAPVPVAAAKRPVA